jgi:ADP-ribose pyrophosphatase
MERVWRVLKSERLVDYQPWLAVARETVQLPNGRVVPEFYAVSMPDFVVVVPLLGGRRVLTERHYKHGARSVTVGLPSGYLHPGEDPAAGAARELLEETGYQSAEWRSIGRFVADGNRGCGTAHLFLARNCVEVTTPDSGDLEEILLESRDVDELIQELTAGGTHELSTAAAIGLAYREIDRHE